MNIRDLDEGDDVISSDGHKVGKLSRVVVNEKSLKLTHLVIDPGLLHDGESLWKGGWGTPHERVVPIGVLERRDTGEIRITMSGDEFAHLSVKYDEIHWKRMTDDQPGKLDKSDIAPFLSSLSGGYGPYVAFDVMAKAPDEVDIKDGSSVWRLKPHEKVGEVDHVIFDEDTAKVTALVIERGVVFHHNVILPVRFIVEVVEGLQGVVRVNMSDEDLDALAAYIPPSN